MRARTRAALTYEAAWSIVQRIACLDVSKLTYWQSMTDRVLCVRTTLQLTKGPLADIQKQVYSGSLLGSYIEPMHCW